LKVCKGRNRRKKKGKKGKGARVKGEGGARVTFSAMFLGSLFMGGEDEGY
jgi:hypothetical protein